MRIITRNTEETEDHLNFVENPSKGKTKSWSIYDSKKTTILGEVKWYSPWRKYVLYTINESALFDSSCLTLIMNFLDRENKKHKEESSKHVQ